MNSIQKLVELFSRFPGIGERQAKRFVYFLLVKDTPYVKQLVEEIIKLKKDTKSCTQCRRFFSGKDTDTKCTICRNTIRNDSELMIVSSDIDLDNIERTGLYNGKYFVLGGTVPILEEYPQERIRIKHLQQIVSKLISEKKLSEIILALSATPEGENTADYIRASLKSQLEDSEIKVSVLGRGISTGTELEYSDSETIKNALENRK